MARLIDEIRELRLRNLELAALLELHRRRAALYRDYEAEVERTLTQVISSALDYSKNLPQGRPPQEELSTTNGETIEAALAKERGRIAQDIHDGLAQQLTAIVLELEASQLALRADTSSAESKLAKAAKIARDSLTDVRHYMSSLRNPSSSKIGLLPALEHLVNDFKQRHSLPVRLRVLGTIRQLETEAEQCLAKVAGEALTNVGKHAQAKQVELSLSFSPSAVELRVLDDGHGFDIDNTLDQAKQAGKMGITGMQERLAELGGELSIESLAGAGTLITAYLPIRAAARSKSQSA